MNHDLPSHRSCTNKQIALVWFLILFDGVVFLAYEERESPCDHFLFSIRSLLKRSC